jgi:rhodanese-related sulfurtransferase
MKLENILLTLVAAALVVVGASSALARSNAIPSSEKLKASEGDELKFQMTAKDLKRRLDKGEKILILDARSHLGAEMIKGAQHVPVSEAEDWAKTADKKAVIVTYCTCPHDEAADSEMKKLRELGFHNVFSLAGGLDAARSAGVEIVPVKE